MKISLDLSLLNIAREKMGGLLVDISLDNTPLPKPDPIAMTMTKKADATTHVRRPHRQKEG